MLDAERKPDDDDALKARINFRYGGDAHVGIAFDETTTAATARAILAVFAGAAGRPAPEADFEKAAEGGPIQIASSASCI